MKKILVLFVSVFTLGLTSCSSDDDSSSSSSSNIEGKWEYYQEGVISGGTESLDTWDHDCPTKKDYIELLNGGVANDMVYWDDCIDDVVTGTWSRSGNNLTVALGSESVSAEIMILDSTTLKVKYVEGGTTYVQVFKR